MNLLLQLSRGFSQRGRGTVFLILNFFHVVAVLKDLAVRPLPSTPRTPGSEGAAAEDAASPLGSAGEAILASFEESLSRAVGLYVEEQLAAGLPQLVAFVRKGESAAAQAEGAGGTVPGFGVKEAAPVAADFGSRWEGVLRQLNR